MATYVAPFESGRLQSQASKLLAVSSNCVIETDGEVFVEGLGQPSNKSCVFRNTEPNLVTFYGDQQITEDVVEFPPGTELVTGRRLFNPGQMSPLFSIARP